MRKGTITEVDENSTVQISRRESYDFFYESLYPRKQCTEMLK